MDSMRPTPQAAVLSLAVYPVKDVPGRPLTQAQVEAEGLEGDRRKKRPVHLVGQGFDSDTVRANVFLDVPDDALQGLVGSEVRLGTCVLRITEIPSACPGVYAEVLRPGQVKVGDRLS